MSSTGKFAHISIHVESHNKYEDPHEGHKTFAKFLSDDRVPPMGLFWLRNKDDQGCPSDCRFDLIHPKHELGLHFHTVTDQKDPEVLLRSIQKEKSLLEQHSGRKISSFSGGHFGLHKDGLECIAEAGFTTDFTVNPGMVMISAKGNPCSYRNDLPEKFWIQTDSGKKILEFPITAHQKLGILDLLVNPLSKIYELIQKGMNSESGFIHITAHSYDFIQSDLSYSKRLDLFFSVVNILKKMGYSFLTQNQMLQEFSKQDLKILSSENIFTPREIHKL